MKMRSGGVSPRDDSFADLKPLFALKRSGLFLFTRGLGAGRRLRGVEICRGAPARHSKFEDISLQMVRVDAIPASYPAGEDLCTHH